MDLPEHQKEFSKNFHNRALSLVSLIVNTAESTDPITENSASSLVTYSTPTMYKSLESRRPFRIFFSFLLHVDNTSENHFYSIRPSLGSPKEPQIPPWLMNVYPRHPRVNNTFGPLDLSVRMAVTALRSLYREVCLMISVLRVVLPLGALSGRVLMDV